MSDSEPLWEAMYDAYDIANVPSCDHVGGLTDRFCYAAEIRAVAKWIETNAESSTGFAIDTPTIWNVTALLHAEADRAEAGE